MECSFLSIGCLPHDFPNISGRSIGNIDGGSAGQCEGCGGGTSAAPQRGQCQGPGSSSTAVELETATGATVGKYLGLFCCQSSFKPVPGQVSSVSRCAGLDIPFSSLYTAQKREEHAYSGSQGPIYLFDPCRLELFLAYCAKGSNRSNLPWIRLPRWPQWEIASYLYGARRQVSEFLKLPSGQCSIAVSFSSTEKSSSISGASSRQEYSAAHLDVRKTSGKRWLRFSNGKRILRDMLSEEFREWHVDKPAEALVLRSLRAVPGSGDCRCGSRQKTSILRVSHVLGRGQFKREFHKGFIPNCTEPCVVSWSLFTKSGRRLCSGQSWRCGSRRQCVMETFSWPMTGKPA